MLRYGRGLVVVASFLATAAFASSENCLDEFVRQEACDVVIGTMPVTIRPDGLITGTNNKTLQVALPKDFYIALVKHESVGGATLLIFEITDSEIGSTLLTLVDPTRLIMKWSIGLPGFNPSSPLFSGPVIYLGAIGTIAKINLSDGRVVWMHRDLYEQDTQAFNSFARPRKDANTIIFTEQKVSTATYKGIREVRVDDSTGRVLSK